MRNIVLDNNIIIDVLSQERRAKYPASKSQGSSKTERAEKSDNYRKRKTSHNHSNKTTI